MPIILDGLRYRYPGAREWVVEHLSLTVDDGEAVALVGPSGSGKSTVLALIGGLVHPQVGSVTHRSVGDVVPATSKSVRVAWVLQSVNLLPRRSVLDNVALPRLARGDSRSAARDHALRYLKAVDLEEFSERQARTLSGGQAQRVGVARALVDEPDVILADEPTANLDPATAREVAKLLFSSAIDRTLIIATHDVAIAKLADRVIDLVDYRNTGGSRVAPT